MNYYSITTVNTLAAPNGKKYLETVFRNIWAETIEEAIAQFPNATSARLLHEGL